ncbi:MAG: fatty acid desaturase [Planctomycetes bacterium]|nr:fatty acid desaturase [Planctomycetota bacterium]
MSSPDAILRQSQSYTQEDPARTRWHILTTLLALVACATMIVLTTWWPLRLLQSVVFALLLVRAFVIYHDVQHGAILRGASRMKWGAKLFGILILSPAGVWRQTHDHHHRNVGRIQPESIGTFPVMTSAAWAKAGRGTRLGYIMQRHALTLAAGYLTVFVFSMCIRPLFLNPRRHLDSGIAILVHAALVTTLALFAPALLLFLVIVPMTIACALGSYLFYAQHNFPKVRLTTGDDWDFVGSALDSSSYLVMGPVMRWFTGNIGYHHVHHVNPKIPFYRLPEAMNAIPELQQPNTTTLWPHEIWKCLRLRLWDEAGRRMVPASAWWARA